MSPNDVIAIDEKSTLAEASSCCVEAQQQQEKNEFPTTRNNDVVVNEISIRDGSIKPITTNSSKQKSSSSSSSSTRQERQGDDPTIAPPASPTTSSSSIPTPPPSSSFTSLGERIQSGTTIVTISNLVTNEEIEYIKTKSIETSMIKREMILARRQTNRLQVGHDNENVKGRNVIRMPIWNSGKYHKCLKDSLPEDLSSRIENILIERVLKFVDTELCPSMKHTLFFGSNTDDNDSDDDDDEDDGNNNYDHQDHPPKLTTTVVTNNNKGEKEEEEEEESNTSGSNNEEDDVLSITKLFQTDQLIFSTREPAVNVYTGPNGHFGIN